MSTRTDHGRRLLAILVFIAGYITARFSLITQAIDLAYFAWDHGVVVSVVRFHSPLHLPFPPPPGVLLADFARAGTSYKGLFDSLVIFLPLLHPDRADRFSGDFLGSSSLQTSLSLSLCLYVWRFTDW